MEEKEVAGQGLSRRNLLKRIGAGGTAVWVAPAVVATSTAAGGLSPACAQWNCGDPLVSCDPDPTCLCTVDTEGNVQCVDGDTSCAGLPICTTTADCPPGSVCIASTCCLDPICVTIPSCGTVQLQGPGRKIA